MVCFAPSEKYCFLRILQVFQPQSEFFVNGFIPDTNSEYIFLNDF